MKNKGILFFVILTVFLTQSCKNPTEKELSFLSFNIWQEGTSVPNGLIKIRDVIVATDPDIVCFVEVRNYEDQDWTTKIVKALNETGQSYYRGYAGGDVSFISKYPLSNGQIGFKNVDKGSLVSFDVNIDGNTIVVYGAHLDYTYYASNLPRGYNGGDPNWEIVADENGHPVPMTNVDSIRDYGLKSTRDETIASFISVTKKEVRPIVLMGDFNEPSWLDWTIKTKDLFDHNGTVIQWPATKELDQADFIDAYRTFYPDELTHSGFTWPANAHEVKSTSWTPLADERERIDYIFYRGDNVELIDVAIVGPRASYVRDELNESNTANEKFLAEKTAWPSDHKGVLAKLSFTFPK